MEHNLPDIKDFNSKELRDNGIISCLSVQPLKTRYFVPVDSLLRIAIFCAVVVFNGFRMRYEKKRRLEEEGNM